MAQIIDSGGVSGTKQITPSKAPTVTGPTPSAAIQPVQAPSAGIQAPAPPAYVQPPPVPTLTPRSPIDLDALSKLITNNQVSPVNLSQYQLPAPNINVTPTPIPQYNAPPPTKVATPTGTGASYLALLKEWGLIPNGGTSSSGSSTGGSSSSFSPSSVNLPSVSGGGGGSMVAAYAPAKSLDQRVQDMLNLEFDPQTNQVNKNKLDTTQLLKANLAGEDTFGQVGDAKLNEVYGGLNTSLEGIVQRIKDLYDKTSNDINNQYNVSNAAIGGSVDSSNASLRALASKLGLSGDLPAATAGFDTISNAFKNTGLQAQSNSMANINTLGANMQATGLQNLANANQYGADRRAQLANMVAGAKSQMQLDSTTDQRNFMQQLQDIAAQRGNKGSVLTTQLGEQDWQHNFDVQKENNATSIANAQISMEAQKANLQAEISKLQISAQEKQNLFGALSTAFGFDQNDADRAYNADVSYQDRLQQFYDKQYGANVTGAQTANDFALKNADLGLSGYNIASQNANAAANNAIQQNQLQAQQGNNNITAILTALGMNNDVASGNNTDALNQFNAGSTSANNANSFNTSLYSTLLGQVNNDRTYGVNTATLANQINNDNFTNLMATAKYGLDAAQVANGIATNNSQTALSLQQFYQSVGNDSFSKWLSTQNLSESQKMNAYTIASGTNAANFNEYKTYNPPPKVATPLDTSTIEKNTAAAGKDTAMAAYYAAGGPGQNKVPPSSVTTIYGHGVSGAQNFLNKGYNGSAFGPTFQKAAGEVYAAYNTYSQYSTPSQAIAKLTSSDIPALATKYGVDPIRLATYLQILGN